MRLLCNEQRQLRRDVGQRTKDKKCTSFLSVNDGVKALMSEDWRPPCVLSENIFLASRCRSTNNLERSSSVPQARRY
jgi:hypothetical protein